MKRIFIIFIAIITLSSCAITSKNIVRKKTLTKEQKEIIDLINSSNTTFEFFSLESEAEYKTLEIWVDIYKEGVLVESVAGLSFLSDEDDSFNGDLVLAIKKSPEIEWTFAMNGATATVTDPLPFEKFGWACSPMTSDVEITDGKEIVLYMTAFSGQDTALRALNDGQVYVAQPEFLSEYAYAHIIKCKFTK